MIVKIKVKVMMKCLYPENKPQALKLWHTNSNFRNDYCFIINDFLSTGLVLIER